MPEAFDGSSRTGRPAGGAADVRMTVPVNIQGKGPFAFVHDGHPYRPKLVCGTCNTVPGERDIRRIDQDLNAPTVGEALAKQA